MNLIERIQWEKVGGLLPVVIQDNLTNQVLMLGYMNPEALEKTLTEKKVTFWSRTKQRLWTKGESSEHYLLVNNIHLDCDQDTLLIQVTPQGPTCHLGTISCFNTDEQHTATLQFLHQLEQTLADRKNADPSSSYTASLFARGTKRISQKVGEEGVEVALAATAGDKKEVINESADLIYHLLVLLQDQNLSLKDVTDQLQQRHK